uniref:RNase_Zc3h12a_2 domain-containing protein n=1 Tax=Schistocephalus solidus TaxID=70667 RepID=A0A183T0N1_SCHSO
LRGPHKKISHYEWPELLLCSQLFCTQANTPTLCRHPLKLRTGKTIIDGRKYFFINRSVEASNPLSADVVFSSNVNSFADHHKMVAAVPLMMTSKRIAILVIQSTSLKVLGRTRSQQQDWFDDNDANISNLLAEKNGLDKTYMDLRADATKVAFIRCLRLVWQRRRETQDAWMIRKAEEIQGYADLNEIENFSKP